MRCGLLHVPQWDTGAEGSGDERVPQAVRRDALVDPGALHRPLDHPIRAVPVPAATFDTEEDRIHRAFTDVEVKCSTGAGCDGDRDVLAGFPDDCQGAVPAFDRPVVMSAFEASEIRSSPFNASSVINAPSRRSPSPARTSRAPSSLRSRPKVRVLVEDVFGLAVLVGRRQRRQPSPDRGAHHTGRSMDVSKRIPAARPPNLVEVSESMQRQRSWQWRRERRRLLSAADHMRRRLVSRCSTSVSVTCDSAHR